MSKKKPDEPAEDARTRSFTLPPPAEAADAWNVIEPDAAKLAEHEVEAPRVDLQVAGEVAIGVIDDVNGDAALRARFDKQVEIEELPKGALSRVTLLGNAAWYVRHQQSLAEATSSTAQVPPELIKLALEVHGRMFKVAMHLYEDDADEGPAVRGCAYHKSYRGLANALLTLAGVYKRHLDVVSRDPKWYVATDLDDARKRAAEIRAALSSSETPEYTLWTERCARVWTLFSRGYDDVAATGR